MILAALFIGLQRLNGTSDFNHIYKGIECVFTSQVIYDCSPYYRFPPAFAYLMAPLSLFLKKTGTFLLIMLVQILSLMLVLERLPSRRLAYISALLLIFPIADTLFLGQINILAFTTLPILALLSENNYLKGFIMSISTWMKAISGILSLHFLKEKPFRFLFGFLMTTIPLLLLGVLLRGWNLALMDLKRWFDEMIFSLIFHGSLTQKVYPGGFTHYKNYTLLSFWKMAGLPMGAYILLFLLSIIPFVFAENEYLSLGLLSVSAIIFSPISWLHYYVILLLPLYNLLVFENSGRVKVSIASVVFLSFILTGLKWGRWIKAPLMGAILLYGWHLFKLFP